MTVLEDNAAALIAVDWGTTNRRGYLIDAAGGLLDRREDGLGLASIEDGGFRPAFDAMVASWTEVHGYLPALLSGMVGASTGWLEAPYCGLPAGLDDLAENLQLVSDDLPVWIVPGVSARGEAGVPDVIRGEEVQAIAGARDGLIVLPGTHSKWVWMKGGRIVEFKTYMTGDLHAAILNHTVVSALAAGGARSGGSDAFDDGVHTGRARHSDLPHILFGARSRVLFGELAAADVSDYLSGLLIGAEISGAFALHDTKTAPKVIGSGALRALYCRALACCGIAVCDEEPDAPGKVYWDLAVRAKIVEGHRP